MARPRGVSPQVMFAPHLQGPQLQICALLGRVGGHHLSDEGGQAGEHDPCQAVRLCPDGGALAWLAQVQRQQGAGVSALG